MGVDVIAELHKRYTAPTPKLWLAIGDAFLILGTTLTTSLAAGEFGKGWIIASALITAAGKIIPGFVTAVEKEKQDQ